MQKVATCLRFRSINTALHSRPTEARVNTLLRHVRQHKSSLTAPSNDASVKLFVHSKIPNCAHLDINRGDQMGLVYDGSPIE
jgi:hypothetical protein